MGGDLVGGDVEEAIVLAGEGLGGAVFVEGGGADGLEALESGE